jgi:hypothetical protein
MIHWVFYTLMLLGYSGLSILAPDLKTKIIGILLTIVNGLIFYK